MFSPLFEMPIKLIKTRFRKPEQQMLKQTLGNEFTQHYYSALQFCLAVSHHWLQIWHAVAMGGPPTWTKAQKH